MFKVLQICNIPSSFYSKGQLCWTSTIGPLIINIWLRAMYWNWRHSKNLFNNIFSHKGMSLTMWAHDLNKYQKYHCQILRLWLLGFKHRNCYGERMQWLSHIKRDPHFNNEDYLWHLNVFLLVLFCFDPRLADFNLSDFFHFAFILLQCFWWLFNLHIYISIFLATGFHQIPYSLGFMSWSTGSFSQMRFFKKSF